MAGQFDSPRRTARVRHPPSKAPRVRHSACRPTAPAHPLPGAEYGPAAGRHHFATLAQKVGAGGTATSRPASTTETAPVWIVGSAKDAPIGDEIARLAAGTALNLCGRTSLAQAIDLIAGARAVVSNDSGLMHVAAALDRPLVALYGSSSPAYTPPLSARATILSLDLACSPCFKRQCPLGPLEHLRCLEDLTPERVLAALPD
jgi:heptosyltransferase-2